MLIQTSSPRPILNVAESPEHIKIHTLRRPGISTGEVFFNVTKDFEHGVRETVPLEPYEVFPIEGAPGFEAMEYYLPFDKLFGTEKRAEYDEARIMASLALPSKRVNVDKPKDHLTDTQLALLGASGFHCIARTAYRTETTQYEERIFNFSIHCPVTGGGIIRVANSVFDVTNPTFNPRATMPTREYQNLTLLNAFNRTHRVITSDIEERRRQRIASAEANMRVNEKALPPAGPKLLPPLKTDLDEA